MLVLRVGSVAAAAPSCSCRQLRTGCVQASLPRPQSSSRPTPATLAGFLVCSVEWEAWQAASIPNNSPPTFLLHTSHLVSLVCLPYAVWSGRRATTAASRWMPPLPCWRAAGARRWCLWAWRSGGCYVSWICGEERRLVAVIAASSSGQRLVWCTCAAPAWWRKGGMLGWAGCVRLTRLLL